MKGGSVDEKIVEAIVDDVRERGIVAVFELVEILGSCRGGGSSRGYDSDVRDSDVRDIGSFYPRL